MRFFLPFDFVSNQNQQPLMRPVLDTKRRVDRLTLGGGLSGSWCLETFVFEQVPHGQQVSVEPSAVCLQTFDTTCPQTWL